MQHIHYKRDTRSKFKRCTIGLNSEFPSLRLITLRRPKKKNPQKNTDFPTIYPQMGENRWINIFLKSIKSK